MNWAFRTPIRLDESAPRHFEHVGYEAALLLWRHRRLIAALIALALLGALAVLLTGEKRYTATALVQVDFSRDEQSGGRRSAGVSLDPSALVETEARFVRSRPIVRQVAEQIAAADGAGPEVVPGEADLQRLARNVGVRNDSRSYLIEISYTANSAERAAEIANRFADTYLANRSEASSASARRAAQWYADQIEVTRRSLEEADRAAADYRRASGLVETSAEGAALLQQQMRELLSQASAAALARLNEESRLQRARQAVAEGTIPSDIAALAQIQRLIEARESARRQVNELAAAAGERHPDVLQARSVLEAAEKRVHDEVGDTLATMAEDVKNALRIERELEAGAAKAKAALIEARAGEAGLRTLQGRTEILRERLKALNEGQMQSLALSELKPVAAQIMAAAEPVRAQSGPKTTQTLGLAGLGAAVLGSMLAFLLERRDLGFRKEEEVLEETGCPCIGLLPAGRLDNRADLAMQRETIRTIIAAQGLAEPGAAKVVLTTSALPGQGKTALTDALAQALVESGRRVLIVDTSPRSEIDGSGKVALEDVLAGSAERKRAAGESPSWPAGTLAPRNPLLRMRPAQPSGGQRNLLVVQRRGGLADSGAVFSQSALADLVSEARTSFDVVLIEAPPVLLAADALILAQFADIVLHAARWHEIPKASVAAALKRLHDGAVRVNGVVLTGVDLRRYLSFRGFLISASVKRVEKYYANFD